MLTCRRKLKSRNISDALPATTDFPGNAILLPKLQPDPEKQKGRVTTERSKPTLLVSETAGGRTRDPLIKSLYEAETTSNRW